VKTYLAGLAGELELGLSGLPGLLLPLGLLLSLGGGSTLGLLTVDPGLLGLGLPVSGLSLGLGSSLAIGTLGTSDLVLTLGGSPSSLTVSSGSLVKLADLHRWTSWPWAWALHPHQYHHPR
jgi:hypothetical protein